MTTIPKRLLLTTASVLATLTMSQHASTQAPSAPPPVLTEFGLEAGTVQDLALPLTATAPFQVDLLLGGVARRLNLRPHDVRAAGFRLLVDDGSTLRQVSTPPSITFRGEVAGAPDSAVSASLVNGQLEAVILLNGDVWGAQALTPKFPTIRRSAHLVYREADRIYRGERCGTSAAPGGPLAQLHGNPLASAANKEAELALDLDHPFYTSSSFGQGNVTTAQNAATSLVNSCTVIYRRDVGVQFLITTIIVRTTPVYSGDIQSRLSQFRSRWRSNHGNVRRDLAHLFSGQSGVGSSGVIGVASLAVVCSTRNGFGASQVGFTGSRTSQIALVCHEMGHQFSAGHCNGASGGCLIMCSSLGGCGGVSGFAPVSANQISSYAQSRSCLSNAPPQQAPILEQVIPTSYTSFRPAGVTLTGTELDTLTAVQVGSTAITAFSGTPNKVYFALPSPFPIGPHSVTVTNSTGTSNPLTLTVTGNHPSFLEAPTLHARGTSADYIAHTDAGWVALYFVSDASGPSVLPGLVSFGIGNSFASGPYQVAAVAASASGDATLTVAMPMSAPSGSFLHWQLATYDPTQLTIPVETSNVKAVAIF